VISTNGLAIQRFVNFLRSNGSTSTLQLPESSHKFVTVRYPPTQPQHAHFVSTVLSKEELFHNFFHYYVANSVSSRKCSGCGQQIATRALCIQTEILCIFTSLLWRNAYIQRERSSYKSFFLSELQVFTTVA
jgi:hypothetical protein